ncbi:MAG: glycosyltransferase family 39 protein [Rivularia sp. ALOHA_DT_140]|nr:glycosyltransferase family 39 protein [Rivularia sp. ALOHA_DT_140]
MTNRKLSLHYLGLTFFISLAIFLRFWNLELKPLWMDEVITAIFSLGKNYNSIPLDVVFSLEKLRDVFSYQPGITCPQIAQNLTTESTHPPLFFCGMYAWLGLVNPLGDDWVNKLRCLSVWFGVALVVAVYFLNRLAFSRKAGLMGAAFVAVSPFAVYLSQEARHYTLPMLMISLSLLALIQIQQDIFADQQVKVRVWVWLSWTIINIISIYIHYFCIIAFTAQIATLVLLIWRKLKTINVRKVWLTVILFNSTAVVIALIPWFGVMQNHLSRSETSWLPTPQHIEPLYQTLISWVVMVIMLPVEGQSVAITIISGLLMLSFTGWLGWKVFKGIKLLLQEPTTLVPTLTLLTFTTLVLLEIFAISYILGKDITVAPRYNFVYYPSFSALIAVSLIRVNSSDNMLLINDSTAKNKIIKFKLKNYLRNSQFPIILIMGFISCIFVVYNFSFQKPYLPQSVAQKIYQEPTAPVMAVMAYRNYQDVALGLSFALALERETQLFYDSKNLKEKYSKFAFLSQASSWEAIFEKLSHLPNQNISQLNLWIFAPGRLRRNYPEQIELSQSLSCNIDKNQHYRIGIPYQLYRCKKSG